MGRRARGLLAALLVVSPIVPLGGTGCAAAADTAALEAEMRALRAEIVREIGNAPCANLVHCRLLALGARPCGGPDEYLAYSSVTGDRTQLETTALEYALLQEDLHRARGTVGACVMLPLPRLVCLDNRCRAE
jgi:hypothetical protein